MYFPYPYEISMTFKKVKGVFYIMKRDVVKSKVKCLFGYHYWFTVGLNRQCIFCHLTQWKDSHKGCWMKVECHNGRNFFEEMKTQVDNVSKKLNE